MSNRRRSARIAARLVLMAVLTGCQAEAPGGSSGVGAPTGGEAAPSPVPSVATSALAPASAAPSSVVAASSDPGPSSSIGPSICTSTRTTGTVVPTTGTAMGHIRRGRILFEIEAGGAASSGTFAFAVIDASGFHATRTTDWTMAHAIWAPQGGIVFDSERNDDRHLFRMNEDGTNVVGLTNDLRAAEQSPASGGGRLVFTHYSCSEPRDLGLQSAAADGSGMTSLTPDQPLGSEQGDDQATVSPDGRTVVFVRFADDAQTRGALFSVPLAGGGATRLTGDGGRVAYPRFSPDGRTILFTQNDRHGHAALWLMPAAGGPARQLTSYPNGAEAFNGDWSPDGTQIALEVWDGGDHNELHVIDADGHGDQVLWRGDGATTETAETPDWGP